MSEVREAYVNAACCASREQLHAHLKESLGFPDYYGANLSALADCLSEASDYLLIDVSLSEDEFEPDMWEYLIRFVQVCAREALSNQNVSLIVENVSFVV